MEVVRQASAPMKFEIQQDAPSWAVSTLESSLCCLFAPASHGLIRNSRRWFTSSGPRTLAKVLHWRECCLTPRSSGAPTAWHLARAAVLFIIYRAGQVPHRRCPLNSHVRQRSPVCQSSQARHFWPRLPQSKPRTGTCIRSSRKQKP